MERAIRAMMDVEKIFITVDTADEVSNTVFSLWSVSGMLAYHVGVEPEGLEDEFEYFYLKILKHRFTPKISDVKGRIRKLCRRKW